MNPKFSVVVAHYGDSFWVNNLISNMFSGLEISTEITIIDNSNNLDTPFQIRRVLVPDIEKLSGSASHANSVNWAMQNLEFKGEFILVLNSDIVPNVQTSWRTSLEALLRKADAVVALQEGSRYLSHPCFMCFKREYARKLDFSEGMDEFGFDTGRLIGLQLARLGNRVQKLSPTKSRLGTLGYEYEEVGILHLTSASLGFMPNRFSGSITWSLKQELRKDMAKRAVVGHKFRRHHGIQTFLRLILQKSKSWRIYLPLFKRRS